MPVAVLVGGLVALALAFAAISAAVLLRQLIEQPIKAAATAVSEVALVGGAIAWGLTQIVNFIEITLAGFQPLVTAAQQQAADQWNSLIYGTVNALYSQLWSTLIWYWANWQGFAYILAHFVGAEAYLDRVIGPQAQATASDLAGLHNWINTVELPMVRGIGDDLAGLHHWIDGYELPLIRGIGDDLAGLHRWIDANVLQRSDVGTIEAQALAQAQALVVPIEATIQAIENSPCMKYCSPLGDLGQLLQGLEDAGLLAIVLALIQEMRTNPGKVAADIDADFAGPIKDVVASLQLGIPN